MQMQRAGVGKKPPLSTTAAAAAANAQKKKKKGDEDAAANTNVPVAAPEKNEKKDENKIEVFDLRTCPPQEYLKRTIFPALCPALEVLEIVRPSDPVEYLALTLIKNESSLRQQAEQFKVIHQAKLQLRAQIADEYAGTNRV